MRDDLWLNQRLNQIWELLFPDTKKANNVVAIFKGKWRNKFGHIRLLRNKTSEIAINSLFRHDLVPEYIIDLTLAHELIHYSHGFQSNLPRKYKHPHQGGIVRRELIKRGFSHMLRLERDFVKIQWPIIYKELCPKKRRRLFRFF